MSYYWPTYSLKRRFKTSFEDGVGKAVMENDTKRIPDLCNREEDSIATMPFSFEGGDLKSLPSEEESGTQNGRSFRQVQPSSEGQCQ